MTDTIHICAERTSLVEWWDLALFTAAGEYLESHSGSATSELASAAIAFRAEVELAWYAETGGSLFASSSGSC